MAVSYKDKETITLRGIDYSVNEIKQLAEVTGSSIGEAVVAFVILHGPTKQNEVVKAEETKVIPISTAVSVSVEYVTKEDMQKLETVGWPAKNLALGINWLLEKESLSEIARALETSVTVFKGKMSKIGIHIDGGSGECKYAARRNKEWKNNEKEMLKILYNAGLSHTKIAFLLGRNEGGVDSKLWDMENPNYVRPRHK